MWCRCSSNNFLLIKSYFKSNSILFSSRRRNFDYIFSTNFSYSWWCIRTTSFCIIKYYFIINFIINSTIFNVNRLYTTSSSINYRCKIINIFIWTFYIFIITSIKRKFIWIDVSYITTLIKFNFICNWIRTEVIRIRFRLKCFSNCIREYRSKIFVKSSILLGRTINSCKVCVSTFWVIRCFAEASIILV